MLDHFYQHLREIHRLRSIRALLEWDQQVCMPVRGAAERAAQIELMSRLVHQRTTAPEFVNLTGELYATLDRHPERDQVNIRETKRHIDRKLKLPESFVAEHARVTALAWDEWTRARPANDFARVAPLLDRIFELSRDEARLVGFTEHPYDALLDTYEPGGTLREIKPLLLKLGEELAGLTPGLAARTAHVAELEGDYPEEFQASLARRVIGDIGYDLQAGRLDPTHHPFQTSIGPDDIRITTRYDRRSYLSSLFTVLHEAGHALYEGGLDKEAYGYPMGSAVSLGIHESQSRLWENLIGRSRPFARYLHRVLTELHPEEARRTSPDRLWELSNRVTPSLIRVEADEVTYSLHVVIRLLLEESITAGNLTTADLPAAWNELYERFLGVRPADDRDGVLQDVHWYCGLFGYFPTYALGNIFGALMLEEIREGIPDLDDQIERGEFGQLLRWLRVNIHGHGMRYHSSALVRAATGREVSTAPFISYLRRKFDASESFRGEAAT